MPSAEQASHPTTSERQDLLLVRNTRQGPRSLPATTRLVGRYIVRVRNTDAWAPYIKAARERAGLTQTEFGRLAGVNRVTVYRWETGQMCPDDPETVERIATAIGGEADAALAAAGLRTSSGQEAIVDDPEVRLIEEAPVSREVKRMMFLRLEELRRRDREQRMEEIKWGLRTAGGGH